MSSFDDYALAEEVHASQLVEIISELAGQATLASYDVDEETYHRWMTLAAGSATEPELRLLFGAETAMAYCAQLLLDDALQESVAVHRTSFPHVYQSSLFGWFAPPTHLASKAQHIISEQSGTPLHIMGTLYENTLPAAVRARYGHFYTRPQVAQMMLDNIGFQGKAVLSARHLDPACGSGVFLIEAANRIIAQAEKEHYSPHQTCLAVQQTLHGLDLNPLGVLLTELALALTLAPLLRKCATAIPPLHVYVTDTLNQARLTIEDEAHAAWQIKNRQGTFSEGFTHISANPPYAKYPSARLTEAQQQRFARTTYGHPNLYGLFLQVGVELLADGGQIVFINPTSFVSGAYFRNLRRFLKSELNLAQFDTFRKRTGLFDGVLQEVVVLSGSKQPQVDTIRLRSFDGVHEVQEITVATASVLQDESMDYAFFIEPDLLAHQLLKQMQINAKPLQEYGVKISTGTIVWNRVKDLIQVDEPGALPLIWGNAIRPYFFRGIGNREGLATHVKLNEKTASIVSSGEALLVKRMTSKEETRRLVACRLPAEFANSQYFVENHVNVIASLPESTISLNTVLGLINSKPLEYLFRSLNGNTNVSATELRLLPVPDKPHLLSIIDELVANMHDADELRRAQIDQAVCDLYDLDEDSRRQLDI
jgi:adenine-specific DNA-methyltransferase